MQATLIVYEKCHFLPASCIRHRAVNVTVSSQTPRMRLLLINTTQQGSSAVETCKPDARTKPVPGLRVTPDCGKEVWEWTEGRVTWLLSSPSGALRERLLPRGQGKVAPGTGTSSIREICKFIATFVFGAKPSGPSRTCPRASPP